ncbi:MAG: ribonuclease P protein component, partial [Gammaproteobacteria bacterium HGW-Gammaproteobacteria-7]
MARLTRPAQFQTVLRARQRRDSRFFRLQYQTSSDRSDCARLGITVSKRVDKRAVGRNRIKRQIRASFQMVCGHLPALDFVVVAKISLSEPMIAQPPYAPLGSWDGLRLTLELNFENYAFLLDDPLYVNAYIFSIRTAFVSAALALVIG